MHDALFDFLGPSLVPELGSDIATRSARYIHLFLIVVVAIWALPNKLMVFILYDLDLACIAAFLTIVALRVELGIHDIFINVMDQSEYRRNVVFHIWHLDVADRASWGKLLELRFERQFIKGVDFFGNMDVITVRDIVAICDTWNDAKAVLQLFREFISR